MKYRVKLLHPMDEFVIKAERVVVEGQPASYLLKTGGQVVATFPVGNVSSITDDDATEKVERNIGIA